MSTDLIIFISFCVLAVSLVVFILLSARKKKVKFPPMVTGTIATPPEPTPEETGPSVDTNDESVLPEVTPLPRRSGRGGVDTTPTQPDVNNEQLG